MLDNPWAKVIKSLKVSPNSDLCIIGLLLWKQNKLRDKAGSYLTIVTTETSAVTIIYLLAGHLIAAKVRLNTATHKQHRVR